jgi:hypothetical protein
VPTIAPNVDWAKATVPEQTNARRNSKRSNRTDEVEVETGYIERLPAEPDFIALDQIDRKQRSRAIK